MLNRRVVEGMIAIGAISVGAGTVSGQEFPIKPVRFITSAAGGGNDFTIRTIAPGLSTNLGQQVIVDNRNAVAAIETVAKAPPDGHTLLITGSILWFGPLLLQSQWDPVKDFTPVTTVVSQPSILVVHPSLPVKSVKELVALARARPGVLNCASAAVGGPIHLAPALFKAVAGVNIVSIPYKDGAGAALIGVIAGQVDMMFPTAASVAQHIKSGRLRALGVTSAQPSELLPGLPTVAAAVPGYEFISTQPVFAPAGTPATVVARLNQGIVRVLNQPDVKKRFFDDGSETVGSTPEQLGAMMKSDLGKWSKLIKDGVIRAE